VFIPGIIFFGGESPRSPKKLTIPQTAAKLCAINIFFSDGAKELQIYHGNFLLMDNEHRKLFVTKQSKGCKFIPEIAPKYILVAGSARSRLGAYALF